MNKNILFLSYWVFHLCFIVSFGQVPEKISHEIKSTPNSLQFFVFGDWGRKGQALANQKKVKNQESLSTTMDLTGAVIKPEFIISTGDNFYPRGVKNEADPRWKETFEDVYRGANLQQRWYVVLGNHDHRGNVKGEIEYDKKNEKRRWYIPAAYYSHVMELPGGALAKFIFIDTTPLIKGSDQHQLSWLANELAEGVYDWKVVVGHHPLYSGSHRDGEKAKLRNGIEKLLVQNNVDAYLCGHDHNLQYLKKGKINYFVSGAGSEIYKSKRLVGITQYVYCQQGVNCTSGFMVFSLEKSTLTVQMINSRGQLLYKNIITK